MHNPPQQQQTSQQLNPPAVSAVINTQRQIKQENQSRVSTDQRTNAIAAVASTSSASFVAAASSSALIPGPSISAAAAPPAPGTSGSQADLSRIRNSLKTAVIQPTAEDARACAQIKPPKSAPTNYWCMIYYYELNERVGEVFKSEWKSDQQQLENAQLIIDGGVCASAENTRFCLGVIGNINRNAIVTKVSRSIGKGIRLYQRDENIFLECLSDSAVFVQCPLFARKSNDDLAMVYKLKGTESGGGGGGASPESNSEPICLFDAKLFDELLKEAGTHGYNALYMLQVYCLCRISFVKGWGQQYRRQTITSCPMWIEVQFPRPLQLLDEVMMEHADEIGAEEVHSFS